ncbi:MAG: BamA/TamA family outer membrane protein [Ignavibacteriales bacterium]|nr:BamA/TamA family outer membrane protein [Ignavibacteriales bacterium]
MNNIVGRMGRWFFHAAGALTCLAAFVLAEDNRSAKSLSIRSIRIEGNETTQPQVILREMALHKGDTLSEISLDRDRNRIYGLRLFNNVTATHQDDGDSTDVLISVVERWYIFPFPVFGIKYNDFGKLYYGLGISHQNFRGRDEKISAAVTFGYDQSYSVSYQNPRLIEDEDIFFRVGLSYQHVHSLNVVSDEYDQINSSGSISLGKRYGLYQSLVGTASFDRWYVPDTSQGRTATAYGDDKFWSFGVRYSYDSRNMREYPTEGTLVAAEVRNQGFGSESNVHTFAYSADVRHYTPVGGGSLFAWRTYGTFMAGGVVPPYQHVFLGYRNRLRGYFRERFEGENIVGGAAELRVQLISPHYFSIDLFDIRQLRSLRFALYGGLFTDVGKAWFRSSNFGDVPWRAGSGVGLHFLLPYSLILRAECALNDNGAAEAFVDIGVSF